MLSLLAASELSLALQGGSAAASLAASSSSSASPAASAWFVSRLNCGEVEAARAAKRLVPSLIAQLEAEEAARADDGVCEALRVLDGTLAARLEVLQAALELSDAELRKLVLRSPAVLGCALEEEGTGSRLGALRERLGLSAAELKKIVLGQPMVLGYSFADNVEPHLAAVQEYLDLDDDELRRLVVRHPPLLALSFEANVRPTLDALRDFLELSADDLKRIVLLAPIVLSCNFEGNTRPTLLALQAHVGLEIAELRKVVRRCPAVVGYSYEAKMAPTLRKLRARLALRDAGVKAIVLAMPSVPRATPRNSAQFGPLTRRRHACCQVLGCSYDGNLAPKLDFLADELGLEPAALGAAVLRAPVILGTSLANTLRPSCELWRREGLDLRAAVAKHSPVCLAYSYEKRVQPRVAAGRASGLDAADVFARMMYTDAKFSTWLASPLASIVDEKVRRVADLSRKMGALGMPIEVSTTKKRTS